MEALEVLGISIVIALVLFVMYRIGRGDLSKKENKSCDYCGGEGYIEMDGVRIPCPKCNYGVKKYV